jgi:NAD dependent epimerase/dehydratase
MKKICITGAGGFIGSHLTEMLVKKGFYVVAFDRYNTNNHYGWLENSKYKKDINFQLGDIRDYDYVEKVLSQVDFCIHLAALIGIPYSYISPAAYIKTNIEGSYNILQASLKKKLKKVIIVSTSEIYGSAQYIPIDEAHPVSCQSPYSATKLAADQLALSYYKSFGLPVKVARPFNTYGPRQSLRAIIPTLLSQFINKDKIVKVGSVDTVRDFTYVEDTCEGIFSIFKSNSLYGEVTNIGSNNSISIKDLINCIKIIFKVQNIKIKTDQQRVRPQKSEVIKLQCNNKKLIKATQWKVKTSLKNGLEKTSKWLEKNINYFKKDIYNI